MTGLREKVFLHLDTPTEEALISDQQRLEAVLLEKGYANIQIPLQILQKRYPLCRKEAGITATLVFREDAAMVAQIEPGDATAQHDGRAVDYGSTTVQMQLADLRSGAVIGLEKAENRQIEYGTDILTRITYSLECHSCVDELQKVTVQTFHDLLNNPRLVLGQRVRNGVLWIGVYHASRLQPHRRRYHQRSADSGYEKVR